MTSTKMSSLITDTFTTVSSNILESFNNTNFITNSSKVHTYTLQPTFNDTLFPPTSIATTFFNNTWLQMDKTAAALIASSDSWLPNLYPTSSHNSSNSPSAYNTNNTGFNTANTQVISTTISHNMADVANIFENFINATTAMSIVNASLFNAEGATATETPYVPYKMRPETYIVPVLFACIFIIGTLGNGTLIYVFLAVRSMRNVPNTYIFSLAVADLMVIVITVPLTSTVYTFDSWQWGSFLCTLSEFIKDVSIGVSVFTLTALSADRYYAITDPLKKFNAYGGGKRATRMTIAIAIAIWLLAIVCGLPALIGTYVKKVEINSNKSFSLCYPFPEKWGWEYAKIMVLLRFLIYYAIPLVIIAIFYALIARHLMYAAHVPGEQHGAVKQVRGRRRIALTVLAFVVIFGICFLPIHVFMLWFYYWPTALEDYNYFWHVLRIVGFCMSFANSCANPVALYFVSGQFRKQFNRYLFCSRKICNCHDTSLTTSRRWYHSTRSCFQQSTIRSRLQETSITMLTNGSNTQNNGNSVVGGSSTLGSGYGNCSQDDTIEVALTSHCCQQHSHQLM